MRHAHNYKKRQKCKKIMLNIHTHMHKKADEECVVTNNFSNNIVYTSLDVNITKQMEINVKSEMSNP